MDFTSLTAAGACDTMFYDSRAHTHTHTLSRRTTTTTAADSTKRIRCALLVNTYLLIRRCSIYPPKTLIYFYTHELYISAKSEITKFSSFSFASPQLWFEHTTRDTHTLDTHDKQQTIFFINERILNDDETDKSNKKSHTISNEMGKLLYVIYQPYVVDVTFWFFLLFILLFGTLSVLRHTAQQNTRT